MDYPMNDTYRWDPAEGIVGVVGVAPAATADFFQRLFALNHVQKDWEHVRVLIDSNPKIPSRGRHLELGETDPSPFIRACIDDLLARGATVVAVPCNTAHILYERYAEGIRDVVPDMISLAIAKLVAKPASIPLRLAVLGSKYTNSNDLYGRRLRELGGDTLDVGEWQPAISAVIEHVKQGKELSACAASLRNVTDRLLSAGCDAVVVACTELSMLMQPDWVSVPVVDASEELARHCLNVVRHRTGVSGTPSSS